MSKEHYKFLFLNQMAGPLFRELAEEISKHSPNCLLYTGHPDSINKKVHNTLTIEPGPIYNRSNLITRFFSWGNYFFKTFCLVLSQPKTSSLFIVSNPPYLGIIGLLHKFFRNQDYYILVYDIYPDLLIKLGKLNKGLISYIWNYFNKLIFLHAKCVFTIGKDMARYIDERVNVSKTNKAKKIVYVPNWADVISIVPLAKEDNWFAKKYNLLHKTVVLYSGNMGNSHDIETILDLARVLKEQNKIHFLFIGEGAKWKLVDKAIKNERLNNVTLLSFQSEDVLPYSIASGDIGVVSYQKGTEGLMVPSKSYYYLAAGVPLLVIGDKKTELDYLITKYSCGFNIERKNFSEIPLLILNLHKEKKKLQEMKKIARNTAVKNFSKRNINYFLEAINPR